MRRPRLSRGGNLLLVLLTSLLGCGPLAGQSDGIAVYIDRATRYFSLEDSLSAEGQSLFDSLLRENHYVILGEYHGSTQIGRLTEALLPIYARHGGSRFGLEIGPEASRLINEAMARETARSFIRRINAEYALITTKRPFPPIPFFRSAADAAFLQTAFDVGLTTVGLDQEYLYSYLLLLDTLEANIPRNAHASMEVSGGLRDTLTAYLTREKAVIEDGGGRRDRLPIRFQESAFIREGLEKLATTSERARGLVRSLLTSNRIYYHNATGDWWNANRLRTENFVENFQRGFLPDGQISDERLFLKIGSLHAAKGMNNYYRYDLGNLIYETARLTGRKSLHAVVLERYWESDDGGVTDLLQDSTSWLATNFGQVLRVGRPDKWTAIDAALIRKQGLYLEDVSPALRQYFERYDLFIIPPADREPALLR